MKRKNLILFLALTSVSSAIFLRIFIKLPLYLYEFMVKRKRNAKLKQI